MNVVGLTEDFFQERTFWLSAGRDALPCLRVKHAEVLFNLPKVGEQAARGVGDLRIAFLDLGGIEWAGAAFTHALDFTLDVVSPSRKVADTGAWIILGPRGQVAQ